MACKSGTKREHMGELQSEGSMKIDYVEMPAMDFAATKAFYAAAFGWDFEEWGDDYLAFSNSGLEGGFRKADSRHRAAEASLFSMQRIWKPQRSQLRAQAGKSSNGMTFPAAGAFTSQTLPVTSSRFGRRLSPPDTPDQWSLFRRAGTVVTWRRFAVLGRWCPRVGPRPRRPRSSAKIPPGRPRLRREGRAGPESARSG